MNTKNWGPPMWESMFFVAYAYEFNKTPKNIKDSFYISYYENIGNVLPCRACRESYKVFYDCLDINKFIHKKNGLLKFVYLLKDLVNKKLITQKINSIKCSKDLPEIYRFIEKTTSPPFEKVLARYSKFVAK